MINSSVSKLSEGGIVNYIHEYRVDEEKDIIFGTPTGRKFLFIRFNDSAPEEVINLVADYYSKGQGLRVDDIEMPYYIILRVQLSSFSSDYKQ